MHLVRTSELVRRALRKEAFAHLVTAPLIMVLLAGARGGAAAALGRG